MHRLSEGGYSLIAQKWHLAPGSNFFGSWGAPKGTQHQNMGQVVGAKPEQLPENHFLIVTFYNGVVKNYNNFVFSHNCVFVSFKLDFHLLSYV